MPRRRQDKTRYLDRCCTRKAKRNTLWANNSYVRSISERVPSLPQLFAIFSILLSVSVSFCPEPETDIALRNNWPIYTYVYLSAHTQIVFHRLLEPLNSQFYFKQLNIFFLQFFNGHSRRCL